MSQALEFKLLKEEELSELKRIARASRLVSNDVWDRLIAQARYGLHKALHPNTPVPSTPREGQKTTETILGLAKLYDNFDYPWNVSIVSGEDMRRLARAMLKIAEHDCENTDCCAKVQRILFKE